MNALRKSLSFCNFSIGIVFLTCFNSYSQIVSISTAGYDDGIQTSIIQDRKEAEINAMEKAIEKAGVKIESKSMLYNGILEYSNLADKIKQILLPNFRFYDMGYDENGFYQVVLIGKIDTDKQYFEKKPTTGIPEEGVLKPYLFQGQAEEGIILWPQKLSNNSAETKEDDHEKKITNAYIHKEVKEEVIKLPPKKNSLVLSNFRHSKQTIDIINNYILMRYGNNSNIIEKNNYKVRYIISGLKNEILENSNKWERIQLDIYILDQYKFLLYIDAFYATGLGVKEPPISGYLDMEKNHYSELSYYVKQLKYRIEKFIQEYEKK